MHRSPVACRKSMLPTGCDFCSIRAGKLINLSEMDSPILSILMSLTQNYLRSWFDTSPRTQIKHVMDAETVRPDVSKGERDFGGKAISLPPWDTNLFQDLCRQRICCSGWQPAAERSTEDPCSSASNRCWVSSPAPLQRPSLNPETLLA